MRHSLLFLTIIFLLSACVPQEPAPPAVEENGVALTSTLDPNSVGPGRPTPRINNPPVPTLELQLTEEPQRYLPLWRDIARMRSAGQHRGVAGRANLRVLTPGRQHHADKKPAASETLIWEVSRCS